MTFNLIGATLGSVRVLLSSGYRERFMRSFDMPTKSGFPDENSASRREMMARIKSTNTTPERRVRSWLHRHGYRFRIHRRDLPGTPDIILPKHRLAILVHGCFWHRHGCHRTSFPKTRSDYWTAKFIRNVERDQETQERLKQLGWKVAIVWECCTKTDLAIEQSLADVLPESIGNPGRDNRPLASTV